MRLRVLVLSGSFHFRGTDHQCQDRSSWMWGQRNQRHRNQNMRSNQAGLPSSGPMIWSKKSCRHLRVVSCQGSAVICLITHGQRGWETRGGEDQKESPRVSGCGVCMVCARLCTYASRVTSRCAAKAGTAQCFWAQGPKSSGCLRQNPGLNTRAKWLQLLV